MTGRPVRLVDVARLAGASPATVSRVINGRSGVDAELAARVRQAVDQLDYRPNRLGRQLRQQRSSVWTVVISDIENPFFTGLVRGLEDVAAREGISVMLGNTDEDLAREATYLDLAVEQQVAGVVIAPASERRSDLSTLRRYGIPAVTVDRLPHEPAVDHVLVDNVAAARSATRHLLDAGFRRIGMVGGPASVTTARQRHDGYRSVLDEAGAYDPALDVPGDFRVDGGRRAMRALLAAPDPPDAVVTANNLSAVGALEAVREAGLVLGRDLGFVSFDEVPGAEYASPSISAVVQPVREIGTVAAELLVARRAGSPGAGRPPQERVLHAELVVRDSSRRAG